MSHPILERLMARTARLLQPAPSGGPAPGPAGDGLQRVRALAAGVLRGVADSPVGRDGPAAAAVRDAMNAALDGLRARGAAPAGGPGSASAPAGRATAGEVIDGDVREVAEAAPAPAPAAAPDIDGQGAGAGAGAERSTPTPARWIEDRFEHPVRALSYRLHVPAGADAPGAAPRPLVLMLHGCTQDPEDFAAGTGMHRVAADAFVLYPAQSAQASPQRCWNWFKHSHQQRGRGEASLLADLVLDVARRHAVDPRRVAVAGLSAGGAMAAVLGQAYPEIFSAVGVHSGLPAGVARDLGSALAAMRSGPGAGAAGVGLGFGTLPGSRVAGGAGGVGPTASSQAAAPPQPTIVIHGDADSTVHPSNGALPPAAGGQRRDPERGVSAGGVAFTRTVVQGAGERPLCEQWVIHGAGHAWSGGDAAGTYTLPAGPDASAAMWDFFNRCWASPAG